MSAPNPGRPDLRRDLTRWNRAGLSQVSYVDGDASVWLEELRLGLLGQYLRGAAANDRLPEFWRDVFMQPSTEWPLPAELTDLTSKVAWTRLMAKQPPTRESRGQRSQRLLNQYMAAPDGDHAWEITRAFARAAHVLLGHLDAYAGEGYMGTATQWDNLRRLAAMVNYQPGPPASASSLVALELEFQAETTEVAKGLATKYAPPKGGSPLIFETLSPVLAHPDLNAARTTGWNKNMSKVEFGVGTSLLPVDWLTGPKSKVNAGDLVVITTATSAAARQIGVAEPAEGYTTITLTEGFAANAVLPAATTRLWHAPDDVRVAEPFSSGAQTVIEMTEMIAAVAGDLVYLDDPTEPLDQIVARVQAVKGNLLILTSDLAIAGDWNVRPMARFAADSGGKVVTTETVTKVWFNSGVNISSTTFGVDNKSGNLNDAQGQPTATRYFESKLGTASKGFVVDMTVSSKRGTVATNDNSALPPAGSNADRSAAFLGKPPKGLAVGSWFVARSIRTGNIQPLKVEAVSSDAERYFLLFHTDVNGEPDRTEFHGPMAEALAPVGYDRDPDLLGGFTASLTGLSDAAQQLLKPGRQVILSRAAYQATLAADAAATLTSVTRNPSGPCLITFTAPEDVKSWPRGDLSFRLNAVSIGHGESKGSRLLGSGDAELPSQSFRLPVKDISHIASTKAVSGVVPDIDVAVDGVVWAWCDSTDLSVDGTQAWSSALTEDGEILVQFRRRLPTGTNNISVLRHRVGTGLKGTGIPGFSFEKPMKKHPQVKAIYQPFPTSGGADRESVASLRTTAPAQLAANGRAVSAADFERLALGNASIWKARAEEVLDGAALRTIRLVLVPAGGAALTQGQQDALRPNLLAHALPGVRLTFAYFESLSLRIEAEVRADLISYDASDVKAAAEAALAQAFGLEARGLGQAVYVSEILAVLETVPEVETAIVTAFDILPNPIGPQPVPAKTVEVDGTIAAIFSTPDQVAYAPGPGQPGAQGTISVTVRGLA